MSEVRLNEFDKREWRDVYFIFYPHATEAEFERDWAEFQREKAARNERMKIQ